MDYSSPTQVKVTTLSGNTYIASFVISTLPLGVMQKNVVAWNPALPPAKVGQLQLKSCQNKVWAVLKADWACSLANRP